MIDTLDSKRSEAVFESPAIVDALLTRVAKHTMAALHPKWRKPVENEVISAAAYFYRKFFSVHQITAFDPERVLLIALVLACKTEESHSITLRDICAGEFINPEEATELELALLEAVDFQLEVDQPWPVILLFSSRLAEKGKSDAAQRLFDASCELVYSWQWSDAVVILPLQLLGIAAVVQAAKSCGVTESFTEIAICEFGEHVIDEFEVIPQKIHDIINRHARPSPEMIDTVAEQCREARDQEPRRRRQRKSR